MNVTSVSPPIVRVYVSPAGGVSSSSGSGVTTVSGAERSERSLTDMEMPSFMPSMALSATNRGRMLLFAVSEYCPTPLMLSPGSRLTFTR